MEIQVSVIIPTYNHENYIEQAIQSVLMQKINFSMEVLIGEDCSTDATRLVLNKLEESLPDHYHIFYRKQNLKSGNFYDLYARMKGKYFIILEGDDFWTYEYKLQEEYDFLESHPDYIAVAHNVQVVNQIGMPIKWHVNECKKTEYTLKEFKKSLYPGQTASILSRNYYLLNLFDHNIQIPEDAPGDYAKAFLLAANGKVFCIQKKWSAYRLVLSNGSSYVANFKYSFSTRLGSHAALYNYARNHTNIEAIKLTEVIYFWYLFACMIKQKCNITFSIFLEQYKNAQYKGLITLYIIERLILLPYGRIAHKLELRKRDIAISKSFKQSSTSTSINE
jgi:glycosyltransferase involved in cell wall biosynthesis